MAIIIKLDGASAGRDKNGARIYSRRFKIAVDATPSGISPITEVDIYAAFAALSPPVAIGRSHPADNSAVCIDLDCNWTERTTNSTWQWTAEAKYTTDAGSQPPTDDPDPTHRPPKVEVGQEFVKVAALKDIDDKPIINAANEPIPYEIDKAMTVITISRTVTTFDYERCKDARFDGGMILSINTDSFGVPPAVFPGGIVVNNREGVIRTIDVATTYVLGKNYLEVKTRILHDPDKHLVKLLNQGYMCYEEVPVPPNGTALILKPILIGGTTPNTPRLLDKFGKLLDVANDEPTSVDFNFHNGRNWDWILG